MAEKQNARLWAWSLASVGFVTWIIAAIWHGLMGQPSIMNLLYPGFWQSAMGYVWALVGLVVGGAFYGWVFAECWNWIAQRK